jgi:hypothetical protein
VEPVGSEREALEREALEQAALVVLGRVALVVLGRVALEASERAALAVLVPVVSGQADLVRVVSVPEAWVDLSVAWEASRVDGSEE